MKEVFILLLVFGVVKSGYLPPEKDFGYYDHDQDISRIFQRLGKQLKVLNSDFYCTLKCYTDFKV